MYESDEWYVQFDLDRDRTKMKFNSTFSQNQTIADTEDFWDIDSTVDDHETYKQ